ncbi:hypothetical protein SETIT_9G132400v2 [Setaria italica]|uniref:Glycosyltransferase n=1 Tax=Setaria italica TaxID=4555 RepID=K4AA66_SETIT|nr:UDP-glycosyltransferase 91D1 [Setaria italica]RCV41393.1 hypothetical protein SETIT_9G132400v2 [Setaria italica]
MDSSQSPPLHIAVFPWLAFGHLLPNLELAERLAARGHRVSFVSTPRIISRLRPVPLALAPLIDFVALPLPRVDGLPDGAEATSDIPPGKTDLHLKALDGLAAPFAAFLDAACADGSTNKVDWLFVDSFQYWAAAAAADRKIPCALILPFASSTLAEFGVPRLEPPVEGSTASILQRFVLTFEKCQLVIHRACSELEPEHTPLLPGIFGKPVIQYGLVPPCPPAQGHIEHDNAALSWLDKQQPESVLFIALGSEPPVTVEQLHEIALGLELAGTTFLWALKKPNGLLLEADGDILPPGFEERTRDRGLVAMGWVPQLSILAHSSVGAFLTHGGWSSTIEGAMSGHPMVFLTFLDEQRINAQLIERKKAGLRVPRCEKDGSYDRQGIAGAIRAVMCEEESKSVFAANAKKMQEIINDRKCQERYIDELIQRLRSFEK